MLCYYNSLSIKFFEKKIEVICSYRLPVPRKLSPKSSWAGRNPVVRPSPLLYNKTMGIILSDLNVLSMLQTTEKLPIPGLLKLYSLSSEPYSIYFYENFIPMLFLSDL